MTPFPPELEVVDDQGPWEPLPYWDEGVTLVQSQFERAIEIREYAAAQTGGDIAAAIIELVNTGLSHQ
jgi:hypothetical protein